MQISNRGTVVSLIIALLLIAFYGHAADKGFVHVKGAGGIRILVDGEPRGVTREGIGGLMISDVPTGQHKVTAIKTGFKPQEVDILLKGGQVCVVTLMPFTERQVGAVGGDRLLRVRSFYGKKEVVGAAIAINGVRQKEKTPADLKMVVLTRSNLISVGFPKEGWTYHEVISSKENSVDVNAQLQYRFKGSYAARWGKGREAALSRFGGSKKGQESVRKALVWLKSVQRKDGSWGNVNSILRPHIAPTALALLTFLGRGETPLSGRHGSAIARAMRVLVEYANLPNLSAILCTHKIVYAHAMATQALSESYALTGSKTLKAAMEKCVAEIVKGQQKGGGFDYAYAKGARWDVSVTGWQVSALYAAANAGSEHPQLQKAMRNARKFLEKTAFNDRADSFYYSIGKASTTSNMTGIGCLCLQLLGDGKSQAAKKALKTIRKKRIKELESVSKDPGTWRQVGGRNLYGWLYDTQAIFNGCHGRTSTGNSDWKKWRDMLESALIRAQSTSGYWETNGHIGGSDISGRILSTCFCTLQLEAYYRHVMADNEIKRYEGISGKGPKWEYAGNARTWTDLRGRKIKAELHSFDGKVATLVTSKGKIVQVPLSKLSKEDQQLLMEKED